MPVSTVVILVLYSSMLQNNPARSHMELLWHADVVHIYQPLLSECTNPETLEAAVGAIQNLAACQWQVTLVPLFQRKACLVTQIVDTHYKDSWVLFHYDNESIKSVLK